MAVLLIRALWVVRRSAERRDQIRTLTDRTRDNAGN
jgi:hypothetical protein